ncbi:hypothetical protein DL769_004117 [Monosporascus sp. CRB-8-3]|nr:hypothetical protein DL769_004117 [Monosporascus sp. CRB-8-3]
MAPLEHASILQLDRDVREVNTILPSWHNRAGRHVDAIEAGINQVDDSAPFGLQLERGIEPTAPIVDIDANVLQDEGISDHTVSETTDPTMRHGPQDHISLRAENHYLQSATAMRWQGNRPKLLDQQDAVLEHSMLGMAQSFASEQHLLATDTTG